MAILALVRERVRIDALDAVLPEFHEAKRLPRQLSLQNGSQCSVADKVWADRHPLRIRESLMHSKNHAVLGSTWR